MTAQHVRPDRTVLACRIVGDDRWCGRCGCKGVARDTVIRHVAHEPDGWHPTVLHVSVSLLPVPGVCSCVVPGHDHSSRPARETLARGGALGGRWAWLSTILAVARIAQALGVSWNTANTSVLSKEASARSSTIRIVVMVCAIGVDEHVSRHTPYGDSYVTAIVDVTPTKDRSGPSRLLNTPNLAWLPCFTDCFTLRGSVRRAAPPFLVVPVSVPAQRAPRGAPASALPSAPPHSDARVRVRRTPMATERRAKAKRAQIPQSASRGRSASADVEVAA